MLRSSRRHSSTPVRMALLVLAISPAFAIASDINPSSVSQARSFMETPKRGKYINSYLHMGSSYDGHDYVQTCSVNDGAGRTLDGEFALVYEFTWDGTGWTTVAFFFDQHGRFKSVRPLKTNATFNQPFLKANLAIAVLGNAMIELFRSEMTAEQLAQARRFIDNSDAKGLLELGLSLQQSLRQ